VNDCGQLDFALGGIGHIGWNNYGAGQLVSCLKQPLGSAIFVPNETCARLFGNPEKNLF